MPSDSRLRCCVLVEGAERSFLRDWKVASSVGSRKMGSSLEDLLDDVVARDGAYADL